MFLFFIFFSLFSISPSSEFKIVNKKTSFFPVIKRQIQRRDSLNTVNNQENSLVNSSNILKGTSPFDLKYEKTQINRIFDYNELVFKAIKSKKIVTCINQGGESEIYSTGKEGILAKIPNEALLNYQPKAHFVEESRFLNQLYGYRLSWIDTDYPQIMYMKKLNGKTWKDLKNDPTVTLYMKALITEKILVSIDEMHKKGMQHNDLNSNNIIVEVPKFSCDIPCVHLIDPVGDFKEYVHIKKDEIRRNHYAKEHKVFVQKLMSLGQTWKSHYPHLIVEKGLEVNWGRICLKEEEEVLLDQSDDLLIDWTGDPLETPLHRSCWKGYPEKTLEFLKRGDNINAQDSSGFTPLMFVFHREDIESCQYLINAHADVNIQDRRGNTALMWACVYHRYQIVKILLQTPQLDINIQDNLGKTALFKVIGTEEPRSNLITEMLLNRGLNPHMTDKRGQNVLFHCCRMSNLSIFRLLLQQGVDLTIKDEKGKTVFDYAKRYSFQVIQTLGQLEQESRKVSPQAKTHSLLKKQSHPKPNPFSFSPMNKKEVKVFKNPKDMLEIHGGFHVYCLEGNHQEVKRLCDSGAKGINHQNVYGQTPLMIACAHDNFYNVNLLIDAFADMNKQDKQGETAIMYACRLIKIGHFKSLIKTQKVDVDIQNNNGRTVIITAALMQELNMVEILIDYGADLDQQDVEGQTVLMIASRLLPFSCVKNILGTKKVSINIADSKGQTALMEACLNKDSQIVKYLLSEGADPNQQNKEGETALIIASRLGNKEVVVELLKGGANINIYDKEKKTALMWSSSCQHSEVEAILKSYLNELLSYYDNLDDMEGSEELEDQVDLNASLFNDILNEKEGGIGELLSDFEVEKYQKIEELEDDLSNEDCDVWSCSSCESISTQKTIRSHIGLLLDAPVFKYTLRNNKRALLEVLDEECQDINEKDNSGNTPLIYASSNGYIDIVKILLENMANPNLLNDESETALLKASQKGHYEIIKMLLEYGSDINHKDKKGNTPLIYASRRGNDSIVKFLLSQGASIDEENHKGNTALMEASQKGHEFIVELLLNHGASVEKKNKKGRTALIVATMKEHDHVVQKFLDYGVNPNKRIQLKEGAHLKVTPLEIAVERGDKKMVHVLMDSGEIDTKSSDYHRVLFKSFRLKMLDISLLLICYSEDISIVAVPNELLVLSLKEEGYIVFEFDQVRDQVKVETLFSSYKEFRQILNHCPYKALKGDQIWLYALRCQYEKSIEALLENKMIHPNQLVGGEIPVLCMAIKRGDKKVVFSLIKNGVDVNLGPSWGLNPLELASYCEEYSIVECLIQNGAFSKRLRSGQSLLYWAVNKRDLKLVELLLKGRPDINKKTHWGKTALWNAIQITEIDIAKMLISHGADVDSGDENSFPLYEASKRGDVKLVHFLVQNGANLDQTTSWGDTALHVALEQGKEEVAECLIRLGASCQANSEGLTPLEIALWSEKKSIANLIRLQVSLRQAQQLLRGA